MTLQQGIRITDFIKKNGIRNILELGFAHGVSTCYMAAALPAETDASLVTVDLDWARHAQPNVHHLLRKTGQTEKVTFYYEPTSYVWRLMKFMEEPRPPTFDLCYLDGAHNWFVDGFAFFLVDRLLRPNGWIIFDDLEWTYAGSPMLANSERVKTMPRDERETPQVLKIYELLVKTHPSYDNFMVEGGWAYAHKTRAVGQPVPVRTEVIVRRPPLPWMKLPGKLLRMVLGRKRKYRKYDPNPDITVP